MPFDWVEDMFRNKTKDFKYKGDDAMLQKYNQNKANLAKLIIPTKGQVEVLSAEHELPLTIHISMNEIEYVGLPNWPKNTIFIIDEMGEVPWEQLAILQEALKNEVSNSKKLGILMTSFMEHDEVKVQDVMSGEFRSLNMGMLEKAQAKFMHIDEYMSQFTEQNVYMSFDIETQAVKQEKNNEINEPLAWKKSLSQKLKDLLISVCSVGKALWMNDKELFVRNLDMMRQDFDELEKMVEKD